MNLVETLIWKEKMVSHPGFETRTFALKGRCSTSWANNPKWKVKIFFFSFL
jgi:hypothetical protein